MEDGGFSYDDVCIFLGIFEKLLVIFWEVCEGGYGCDNGLEGGEVGVPMED